MGKEMTKCHCDCNKEEQLTRNFEKENTPNSNGDNNNTNNNNNNGNNNNNHNLKLSLSLINQDDNISNNNNNNSIYSNNNITPILQVNSMKSTQRDLRNFVSVKSNNLPDVNQNISFIQTPSFVNARTINFNNNNNSNSPKTSAFNTDNTQNFSTNCEQYTDIHIRACIYIQAIFRGYNYRENLYPEIKCIQIEETNKMIKSLSEEFIKFCMKSAERNFGNKYSKKGWKIFYSDKYGFSPNDISEEMKRILSFNYGFVLNTKIKHIPHYSFYSGQVNLDNEKHGYGIYITSEGFKYEGFWNQDSFTGWGRIIDKEGVLMEGIFNDAVLTGKGIKKSLNGNIYIGDFVNNIREGKGKEITNELIYEGEFKDDKKNGKGKLVYKLLRDIYEGDFVDNKITGEGYFIWGNRDTYKGTFLDGKMHGKGVYKWPDGGEYYGDYVNNVKEGFGVFRWTNGKIYEGEFKNGKPDGIGKLKTHKRDLDVEFKDGRLITNVKELGKNNETFQDHF